MDFAPLVAAFVLIALTEIGDKTMIAVITLSSKHARKTVFVGALAALTVLSILGVAVGQVLFDYVPRDIIEIAAGVLFIVFGAATLLLPEKEKESKGEKLRKWGGLSASFGLVAIMELGDKTQLSIIALSAQYGDWLLVLCGAVIGFALVTLIGVTLGAEIGKRVPEKYIRLGSGMIFLVFGVIFLAQALL